MQFFRWVFLLLLLGSGGFFAAYIWTSQVRYRHYGLLILRWTVFAALGFFAVLILQRIV